PLPPPAAAILPSSPPTPPSPRTIFTPSPSLTADTPNLRQPPHLHLVTISDPSYHHHLHLRHHHLVVIVTISLPPPQATIKDLIPIEPGSFDVIIGMNWLTRYHAMIIHDKKIVRIPLGDKTLMLRSNISDEHASIVASKQSCLIGLPPLLSIFPAPPPAKLRPASIGHRLLHATTDPPQPLPTISITNCGGSRCHHATTRRCHPHFITTYTTLATHYLHPITISNSRRPKPSSATSPSPRHHLRSIIPPPSSSSPPPPRCHRHHLTASTTRAPLRMTSTVVNNSVFSAFFEKQKLTGPNFIDWCRNLHIALSVEDKLTYLEHPLPIVHVPVHGQVADLDVLAAHTTWVKAPKEIAGLMLMTMDPEIQKNLVHLGAYDMLSELKSLFSKQAEQKLIQTVREFHACKQEKGQS
nr:zinc finger, CCHC-type [Tanacetum cinerariifolium]